MKLNRRIFLKYTGLLAVSGSLSSILEACGETSTSTPFAATPTGLTNDLSSFNTPLNLPGAQNMFTILEPAGAPVNLSVGKSSLAIFKNMKTDLLTYPVSQNAQILHNPILKIKKGEMFTANVQNNLTEETTIHWHGLQVPWKMDGHPSFPIKAGATYQYSYTLKNRGSTYWYHTHAHKLSTQQAYRGLAGFYIVEDEDTARLSQALDLELGKTDIPLLIQDKIFDGQGQLVYPAGEMVSLMGLTGDTILVNATAKPSLELATRIYRFRLLNGSNARIYRLALCKATTNEKVPYTLVGTDGGLLDRPYQVTEVFLAPAERIDILVDLQKFAAGETLVLRSLQFDPLHQEDSGMPGGASTPATGDKGMGGMPGMNGTATSSLADGQEFNILKLVVKEKINYTRTIPSTLATVPSPDLRGATTRPLVLSMGMMGMMGMSSGTSLMGWLINGLSYKIDEYPLTVQKGASEIWEIRNEQKSMPHPIHLHGFQFQVIERLNSPAQLKALSVDAKGRVATDLGYKDTILVWPGETVRLALNFSLDFADEQTYLVHCHNFDHEVQGMMLNYKVV